MDQRGKGGTVIQLHGNRSAVVDGCDGILAYGEEEISFRAGRLTVSIAGRDLRLKRLTENSALVEGAIQQVRYGYGP